MRFGAAVNLAAALPVGFSLNLSKPVTSTSCRRLHSLTTANHPRRLARGRRRGMNDNGSDEVAHGGLFLEGSLSSFFSTIVLNIKICPYLDHCLDNGWILKNGRRDRHGLTCSFV
jgi:hypothetical protein